MEYTTIIKELREELNIKQKEIANILNISRGLYSQYEIADKIIFVYHLNTLSNYFNVPIDYLLGLTSQKKKVTSKSQIDINSFAQRFKIIRKELGLTQEKLANFLNTSHSVISAYENGKTLILTSFLYNFCLKYNISADYLLGKTNEPKFLK